MLGFGKKKDKTDVNTNQDFLNQLKTQGVDIEIQTPEYQSVDKHGTGARIVGTLALGLIGFAATSGSKQKRIKFNGTLKLHNKGILIQDISGQNENMKIEWNEIIEAEKSKDNKATIDLNLINGITFSLGYFLIGGKNSISAVNAKPFYPWLIEAINEECKGIPDNWNQSKNICSSGDGIPDIYAETEITDKNNDENPLEAIKEGKELLDIGAITNEEFELIKEKYLKMI